MRALAIADAMSSVGLERRSASQRAEVLDEVSHYLDRVLGALPASALVVIEPEQLLGPSDQPGKSLSARPSRDRMT